MKTMRWFWLLPTLAAFFSPAVTRAAEDGVPHILFVQLRLKDGGFSLLNATNVPGTLKSRRGERTPPEYQFVLEDEAGKELSSQGMNDPSVQRLEYEDPAHPGEILVKEIRRTEVEFSVRLAAGTGQKRLAIYRRSTLPAEAVPGRKTPARELVTRLPLGLGAKP